MCTKKVRKKTITWLLIQHAPPFPLFPFRASCANHDVPTMMSGAPRRPRRWPRRARSAARAREVPGVPGEVGLEWRRFQTAPVQETEPPANTYGVHVSFFFNRETHGQTPWKKEQTPNTYTGWGSPY